MKNSKTPEPREARPDLEASPFTQTLSEARQGDAAALGRLFEQFYPSVQEMVHRALARDLRQSRPWLASRFSTGDVVQEVFRSVLKDLRGFGGTTEDAFRGYLAMIVRNRLIDAVRFHEAARRDGRRAKLCTSTMDSLTNAEGEMTNRVASEELVDDFHRVLADFEEREQLLLRARLEQEASFQALADQLGYASAGIARRAFYAAQAQLLLRLGKTGQTEQTLRPMPRKRP